MSDQPVLQWIRNQNIKYLAIHIDLDVLDFHLFHALLMAEPGVSADKYAGIAEHLPWDALNLKNMLAELPLINGH